MQPGLHGAIALIPAPSFGLAQTRTVGPHGCWDCLAGVPASPNVGFALGGSRNGRGRQKNGRGDDGNSNSVLVLTQNSETDGELDVSEAPTQRNCADDGEVTLNQRAFQLY